ncbi:MAG TPA: terminase family protein [Blastocatellia bacterium]
MANAIKDDILACLDPARLGALAGVSLDPWQQDVMNFALGPHASCVPGCDRQALGARASCLPACDRQVLGAHASCVPGYDREALGAHASCVPDCDRLLLNCHRQSGKSTVVALKALWTGLYQKGLVLLLSPSLRQSRELFKKVTAFYELLGRPVSPRVHNSLELEFRTGGRIVSLPSSEATIRGFSGPTLIIMDEASRIPTALFEAIIPMQSVSGGALILLSTPWGKRGFFYEAWDGTKGDWTRIERPATDCPRISPERLAEARDLMDEPKFNREYLCKFTEAPGQYFSEESLERAFRRGNRHTESGDPYGSLSSLFSDPWRLGRDSLTGSDSLGQSSVHPETDGFTDEELAAQALLELGGGL